jgi:hypothetical protein
MVRTAHPRTEAEGRPPDHDTRSEPAGWPVLVGVILLIVFACVV